MNVYLLKEKLLLLNDTGSNQLTLWELISREKSGKFTIVRKMPIFVTYDLFLTFVNIYFNALVKNTLHVHKFRN